MLFNSVVVPPYSELYVAHVTLDSVSETQREQLLSQYCPAGFGAWKPARQASFLAGRAGVKQWLDRFSKESFCVPRQSDGSPLWPESWLGSIAHCRTQAVAILHQNTTQPDSTPLIGLGIDVECMSEALTLTDSADLISFHSERVLFRHVGYGNCDLLLAIFSIKESVFKAVYPTVGGYIDFLEVKIISIDRQGHWSGQMLTSHTPQGSAISGVLWRENSTLYSVCLFAIKPQSFRGLVK